MNFTFDYESFEHAPRCFRADYNLFCHEGCQTLRITRILRRIRDIETRSLADPHYKKSTSTS